MDSYSRSFILYFLNPQYPLNQRGPLIQFAADSGPYFSFYVKLLD
jgi:hypothetical protein